MCGSRYSERICPASNDNSEKMSDVESARRAMLELAERAKQDAGLEVKLAKSIREFYNTATGMEHPLFAQDALQTSSVFMLRSAAETQQQLASFSYSSRSGIRPE